MGHPPTTTTMTETAEAPTKTTAAETAITSTTPSTRRTIMNAVAMKVDHTMGDNRRTIIMTDLHREIPAMTATAEEALTIVGTQETTAMTMIIKDITAKAAKKVPRELLITAFQLIRRSRIWNSVMSSAMTRLSKIDTARLKITESLSSVLLEPDPTKELIPSDIQTPTPVDAVWTTPGPNSARDRPPNAQVTALRLSKLLDPSPLLRPVPEAAAKRRSKPPMVLVPTTTRRFNVSVTLATMTSVATKSVTAVTSQSSAPAQTTTIAIAVLATKNAKIHASIAAEKAADTVLTLVIALVIVTLVIAITAIVTLTMSTAPMCQRKSLKEGNQRNTPQELHTNPGENKNVNVMHQSKATDKLQAPEMNIVSPMVHKVHDLELIKIIKSYILKFINT
jgi:hypothetical protein